MEDNKDTFTFTGEDTLDLSMLDTMSIPSLTTEDILTLSNTSPTWGNLATITLTGSANNGWTSQPYIYTVGGGGGGGTYNTVGGSWSSTQPSVKIQGDADIDGNLKVGGINIVDMLQKIQDRLAILVPDPKRLEKYAALQEAYEHYRTLEALCIEQDDPNPEK
jgi:hypothetical protein